MTQGSFFSKSETVSGNGEMVVNGSSSSTGAVEVHTIATGAAQKVLKEVDTNGDGTFDVSIQIEDKTDGIHSQKNKIEISNTDNMRLRVVDTSGNGQDMHVTGIEVLD